MQRTVRNVLAVALLTLPLACGSAISGHPARAQTTAITIVNFAFTPATLTVTPGTTVTWTNQDSVAHTVTSDSGLWDSGTLNTGASFSRTFSAPGTFPYHCAIHPFMKAQIVVQATGVTATPQPSPTPTSTGAAPSPTVTSSPTLTPAPTATPTSAPAKPSLLLTVRGGGKLRVGHSITLRVSVLDSRRHKAVRGATVTLDARKVGLRKILKVKTNGKGAAGFRQVRPTRPGKLTISVSKKGFAGKRIHLGVRP